MTMLVFFWKGKSIEAEKSLNASEPISNLFYPKEFSFPL